MILKGAILIISYIPYIYKEGGFCISINPKNQIKTSEIELNNEEKLELESKYNRNFKNETPIYSELFDQYFKELLENHSII